ncbi:MAG: glycosyltransferase family 39 protein [Nannocystaceae bacterium]|nr:glycosyltransferase family 39 protein [Nannocystaceae bacterium]
MQAPAGNSPETWWRRPIVWALAATVVLGTIYFASMAATGLWDPWETHYGEVARQMLVRHDPLDTYWKGGNGGPDGNYENTFWSKPALPFWLMALSMKLFGVGMTADPAEMVSGFWPELALRLPSMLAGMGSAVFLGWVLWRLVSPRAGILAAIALATMPQWAIVTRQALTDMFFVGPVVLAAGAWAMAWLQPDRDLRRKGRGRWTVPWDRAFLAFLVLFIVSVVVPLAVIHAHSFDPYTWSRVGKVKRFAAGLRDIQTHMFIYWALVLIVVVRSVTWKRRSQAWMGIMYLAGGLSLLGKGMIGPGLIGLVVLVHLIVAKRWRLLLVCGLPTGILLFALAGFPWHHAMLLYRGEKFFSELIVVNNLQRFSTSEQKQAVGGFAYYLETMGLGALPWVAVMPLALWAGARSFVAGPRSKGPRKTRFNPTIRAARCTSLRCYGRSRRCLR